MVDMDLQEKAYLENYNFIGNFKYPEWFVKKAERKLSGNGELLQAICDGKIHAVGIAFFDLNLFNFLDDWDGIMANWESDRRKLEEMIVIIF